MGSVTINWDLLFDHGRRCRPFLYEWTPERFRALNDELQASVREVDPDLGMEQAALIALHAATRPRTDFVTPGIPAAQIDIYLRNWIIWFSLNHADYQRHEDVECEFTIRLQHGRIEFTANSEMRYNHKIDPAGFYHLDLHRRRVPSAG
jgi:hypothetical protein